MRIENNITNLTDEEKERLEIYDREFRKIVNILDNHPFKNEFSVMIAMYDPSTKVLSLLNNDCTVCMTERICEQIVVRNIPHMDISTSTLH